MVIASKDLRRQPIRSVLTLLALIISTVILILMSALSIGGRQAIVNQFGSSASLSTVVVTPNQSSGSLSPFGSVQQVSANASKLSDATVAQLVKLPHVQSITPRAHIWEFSSFSVDGNSKQFVAQTEGIPGDAQLSLDVGTMFSPTETGHVAVLGYAYVKALGYGNAPRNVLGKTLHIATQKGYRGAGAAIPSISATSVQIAAFNQAPTMIDATIVGVTRTGPDQNSVFIPLGWAHAVRTAQYSVPGGTKTTDQLESDGYTTLQVRVDNTSDVKAVTADISQLGYGQMSILSQIERVQQFSTMMWVILGAVAAIAVVASALGVVNTMLMTVSEQRYAIGVWRACGARKGFIVGLFLTEAAILGFVGGTIGVGLGIVGSQFVNEYVNSLLTSQGLSLANIANIPLWLMVGTVALTTLFGALAGLYPAYRAARQDPSSALSGGQ
jgi:ABC-type antimicrobial peptide transport system permease subunit